MLFLTPSFAGYSWLNTAKNDNSFASNDPNSAQTAVLAELKEGSPWPEKIHC